MRFAYSDPPYPGQSAKHYSDHPDYAGEVDHAELIGRMERDYDGWLLYTSSTALRNLLPLTPEGVRIFAWVKPFAVFKRNVSPAYAWEPIIVKPLRKGGPNQSELVMRDWLSENVVLNKGEFAGAKSERLCRWLFEACGLHPDDELDDLYPGSGAVSQAWEAWRSQLTLELAA